MMTSNTKERRPRLKDIVSGWVHHSVHLRPNRNDKRNPCGLFDSYHYHSHINFVGTLNLLVLLLISVL